MRFKQITQIALLATLVIASAAGCGGNKNKQNTTGTDFGDGWLDGPEEIWQDGKPFELIGDPLPPSEIGVFNPLYFAYNAYNIAPAEMAKAMRAAEFLASTDNKIVLIIEGHADERGTSEYNITLGEHRALNVRDQIIAAGISPARVQTVSYGKERPAVQGHNESAWSKNRRAEFAFYRLR